MDVLVLRFDAPLMSFGGVKVDQRNPTDDFPSRSMLTGLLANALGYEHADSARLAALQARLRYAARLDDPGQPFVDYQTVDLSGGPMRDGLGWTTAGRLEERKGGTASEGTHIRLRHYRAGAVVTVAVTLDDASSEPTLVMLRDALLQPARPLFLGRKCCIPSGPILPTSDERGDALRRSDTLREVLEAEPRAERAKRGGLRALWPEEEGAAAVGGRPVVRVEDRDWRNAIHVGRRFYIEGLVDPPPARHTNVRTEVAHGV